MDKNLLSKTYFLLLFICVYPCLGLAKSPIWQVDTSQRFHPQQATHGIVVTQDDLASQVGVQILKKGGNAIDAAVAVGFTLAVTLPRAGNLGGGGFMLVWLNKSHKAVAINYREAAPLAATPTRFAVEKIEIGRDKQLFNWLLSISPSGQSNHTTNTLRFDYVSQKNVPDNKSLFSVGIPGTVAGLTLALQKYGTMKLTEVMQPAIELASKGFKVSPAFASVIYREKEKLKRFAASRRIFFKADGSLYQPGDWFVQKELAHSLSLIANQGASAFYQGVIAKKIVAAMQAEDGLITHADLGHYRAEIVEPVSGTYHDYQIIGMPPPSSGGVTLIEILNILENYPLHGFGVNSAMSLHLMAEAINLAYRDRLHYLGDPKFTTIPLQRLLSKEYAKNLSKLINTTQHTSASDLINKPVYERESFETTHYSIIDREGNMVANTYTLNYAFGIGYTVPGTGILLNNEMDDFSKVSDPNQPSCSSVNQIAPGKQPLSSMAPTLILTPDGKPYMVTGSPGGPRIIPIVLQVILNTLAHKLNLATAVNMPRIHSQLFPDMLLYEQGISPDTLSKLQEMGHKLQPSSALGAAQSAIIYYSPGHFSGAQYMFGAADPRRAGASARGY